MPSFGAIKALQLRTGATRAACKQALEDHNEDEDAAAAALGVCADAAATAPSPVSSTNQQALSRWSSEEEASSLSVLTVEAGDGSTFPQSGDTISMHYRGRLRSDGSEFDSSYARNRPFTFKVGVGNVIRGWDLGCLQLSLGQRAQLLVASDYAYGPNGHGPIPPCADLIFDVHLLKVVRRDGTVHAVDAQPATVAAVAAPTAASAADASTCLAPGIATRPGAIRNSPSGMAGDADAAAAAAVMATLGDMMAAVQSIAATSDAAERDRQYDSLAAMLAKVMPDAEAAAPPLSPPSTSALPAAAVQSLLALAFDSLPPASLGAAAATCRLWRDAAAEALWAREALDLRASSGASPLSDDELGALVARAPSLRFLNLSSCEALTDAGLAHLKGLAHLRSLNLASLPKVTADGVAAVVDAIGAELTDLELGGCSAIGSAELVRRFGRFLELDEDEDGLAKVQG